MKTKLHPLFIALALLADVHFGLAQPALGITSAGNQILLSWPATAMNYILQSNTNLSSINWVLAMDAVPVTYSSQVIMAVTASSTACFRLIFVPSTSPDEMALIPTGTFTIGDTLDGESDAISAAANLSPFYMDTNLVSSNQWEAVYIYATNHGYTFDHIGAGKATNQPVYYVDWYDAVKWCNARSQQAGLTPAYYTDSGFTASVH